MAENAPAIKPRPEGLAPPDSWQHMGACYGQDPDMFFPTSEEEAAPALALCGRCPVRQTCLEWALKYGERYGVWGGTTEQQRRRLLRSGAASRLDLSAPSARVVV